MKFDNPSRTPQWPDQWLGLVASSTAAATANANALQAAMNAGGLIEILTPGDYYIGQASGVSGACLSIPSDVTVFLARGVRLIQYVAGLFAFNSNWKSNAVSVDKVVSNVESPSHIWAVTFESLADHLLSVGDYAYIKADVTGVVNGVYKVTAVTSSVRFTVTFWSQAGIATGTFSSKPKVYKGNANIHFHGDGVIDCSSQGTSNVSAMGIVLNKVGRVNWEINVKQATKYGIYFSNAITCKFKSPYSENNSASVQGIGPIWDIEFDDMGGMGGDDLWAITTTNGTAYTGYDLTDTDTTVNVNGDCIGVRFRNSHPQHITTRSILLDASTGYKIESVDIDGFQQWKVGPALVNFSSPSALADGTFNAISIRNCGGYGALFAVDQGAGSVVFGVIRFENIKVLAPFGLTGVQSGVFTMGSKVTSSKSIGFKGVYIEADNTGGSNLGVIELSAGTHQSISLDDLTLSVTGSGSRTVYGILATGTAIVTAQMCGFRSTGQYCQMFNHGSSGAGNYDLENFTINGSASFIGSASQGVEVRAANGKLVSGDGGFNLFGSSKTYSVSAVNVKTGGQSLIYNVGASSTLTLSGSAIDTTADLVRAAGVGASANIRLGGASLCGAQIDGTKIDATVGNHRAGAMFYNNNASFGAGVGAYVRGATTWTRVAA